MLSARTFPFCIPTQFIHSVSLLFPVVYLYKHYADMLSSVYAHILLTSKCHGFCWHVFTLPSWALLPRALMMPEEDTKHMKSAIPAVVPRFERCTGKVESDMLLSLTRNDVFADQPRSHACVVTAQVWMLKQRESLTKRLFEHWLNISRSYKKQHGIEATVGKRGSRNQILCTAVTFFFFPFCGFLSPVPMQINWAGLATKTSVTQMQCMFPAENIKVWVKTSQIITVQLFCLPFEELITVEKSIFELWTAHKTLTFCNDLCTPCCVWIWNTHQSPPNFAETVSLCVSLLHTHTLPHWMSESRAQLRSFQLSTAH